MEENIFILALKQTFTWDWVFLPLAFISFWSTFILFFFTYRYIEKNIRKKRYSDEYKQKQEFLFKAFKIFFILLIIILVIIAVYKQKQEVLFNLFSLFPIFFVLLIMALTIIAAVYIFFGSFLFDVFINKKSYSKEHKFIWLFRVALFFMIISIIYILQK